MAKPIIILIVSIGSLSTINTSAAILNANAIEFKMIFVIVLFFIFSFQMIFKKYLNVLKNTFLKNKFLNIGVLEG